MPKRIGVGASLANQPHLLPPARTLRVYAWRASPWLRLLPQSVLPFFEMKLPSLSLTYMERGVTSELRAPFFFEECYVFYIIYIYKYTYIIQKTPPFFFEECYVFLYNIYI